jgi:hypothetical protein
MRYGLAWRGVALKRRSEAWTEFMEVAAKHAGTLLSSFRHSLPADFQDDASFSLYISQQGGKEDAHWRELASEPCPKLGHLGSDLYPHSPRSKRWICWWGDLAVAKRGEPGTFEKDDLCDGEDAAVYVPVRPAGSDPNLEPVAMVRIGYYHLPNSEGTVLHRVMDDATTLLLNEYINLKLGRRNTARVKNARTTKWQSKPAAGKKRTVARR